MRRLCVGSVRVKIGRGRQGEERLPIKQHQHFEERVGGKKELNVYIYIYKKKKKPTQAAVRRRAEDNGRDQNTGRERAS